MGGRLLVIVINEMDLVVSRCRTFNFLWGFGRPTQHRSLSHDRPSPYLVFHFAWAFCDITSRESLLQFPVMRGYVRLRIVSTYESVSHLRHPVQDAIPASSLSPFRTRHNASALLHFNFVYGDFARWLGSRYTMRFRNWNRVFSTFHRDKQRLPHPAQPPVDIDRCFRICTEGIPLHAQYHSNLDDLYQRNLKDNHVPIASRLEVVESKFAKEENFGFHLTFPRWTLHFIYGLMLNPLQWAIKHGKGRICVDCTFEDKWDWTVTETITFLGLEIDCHNITVSWPLTKRQDLAVQPVAASVCLIRRADLLQVPLSAPICAHPPFQVSSPKPYTYLADYTVRNLLREASLLTYPDPAHHLHGQVQSLTCHSFRVTAALCLFLADVDINTIAFKL